MYDEHVTIRCTTPGLTFPCPNTEIEEVEEVLAAAEEEELELLEDGT